MTGAETGAGPRRGVEAPGMRISSRAGRGEVTAKRKYDWDPSDDERERAWLFRLDPR